MAFELFARCRHAAVFLRGDMKLDHVLYIELQIFDFAHVLVGIGSSKYYACTFYTISDVRTCWTRPRQPSMMFNPLGEALPKKARTGKRWCEVCGKHRPRQRRQCQCCARYAGPGCMPQRCWTNDHMKLCRYCAHRFLLREIPALEKDPAIVVLSFL